jgi:hypothetical protein
VDGRLVFTWVKESAGQKRHEVGVSFPKEFVEKVFDPSEVTFVESNKPRKPFDWEALFTWIPYIIIILIIAGGAIGGHFANRAKRMHYMPPETKIEGLGPCRDLDPIEAAVVMELPLSRVVALIMMQLVQKKCIEVQQIHPLRVNILKRGGLKKYERSLLKALEPDSIDDEKTRDRRLTNAVTHLIERVRDKLKRGFSRKATADFYRGKIDYMWNKIEQDPQLEHLSWIVLDVDCAQKVADNPARERKLEPLWREHYYDFFDPRYRRRNFFSLFDDFESNVIPDNTDFTMGVSKSTNPTAWIQSSGWSSGGGGGSCACACAGCACACAGGGR